MGAKKAPTGETPKRRPAPRPKTSKIKGSTEEREFVLKFAGRPDSISAATFLESLSGITSVVQEANLQLGTGERLDIKIRAPRPGSFLVNLLLDPETTQHVANLFAIGGGLIGAVAAAMQIWQFLKGEPPKSVEPTTENEVEITNSSGNVIIQDQKIVNFVLSNSTVSFNLARTFGALESDPNVTALEVLDREEKRKLVTVKREEFADLAVAPAPVEDQKRDITVRTRVSIIKPSFDPKLRWEIVYNGNRIGAIVSDRGFYESIDKGEKFSKGDTLEVSLRVRQEYDATLKTFLNKSYEIVAVHAHVTGAEQRHLFGTDTT